MNTEKVLNCDGAGKATLATHSHSQSSGQQQARSVQDVNKSQTMLAQSGRVSATEIVYCLRQIRATGKDLRTADGRDVSRAKIGKKEENNSSISSSRK